MPRKKSFLLVSLQEKEAKKLAQIVSNDTCRKILEYLGEHESTETELAQKLNLAISTVHYNLQALQKGGLVESKEFHYSEKGREVSHYKLANKYIIIAPKATFGLKEKLRNILPIGIIALGAAIIIEWSRRLFGGFGSVGKAPVLSQIASEKAADGAANATIAIPEGVASFGAAGNVTTSNLGAEAVNATTDAVYKSGIKEVVTRGASEGVQAFTAGQSIWTSPGLWLIIGVVFGLGLYLLITYIKSRKKLGTEF